MKSLWENFRLQARALFRSKSFALLLAVSVAWMLAFPYLAKDDGTANGAFELRTRYALGIVFILVLVSLAAAAAGALSKDRAAKRLQLTLVRPVARMTIAWGRSLALTAVGAVVLGVAAILLYIQVGAGRTCDHESAPTLESPQVIADRLFAEQMADPNYPEFHQKVQEQGDREIRRFLAAYVAESYETIEPGETKSWPFDLTGLEATTELALAVRFTEHLGRTQGATGVFRLGERSVVLTAVGSSGVKLRLSPGAVEGELVFTNTGTVPVSICPRKDLLLLVAADSFAANLFRAWLELSAVLALVVAVAVLLGACFSRGVALFVAFSILVVMVLGPSVIEEYPDPTTLNRIDRLCLSVTEFSTWLVTPLCAYSPVSALERERCVEWAEVAHALACNLFALPLVLSSLAGLVMLRKQEDR